jgi:hypothetical protein
MGGEEVAAELAVTPRSAWLDGEDPLPAFGQFNLLAGIRNGRGESRRSAPVPPGATP